MLSATLAAVVTRELDALRRELEAYPDEASIWRVAPGVANSGGVLTRHLCGNLQHYLGAVLGGSGYRRDRESEFKAPPVPRAALLAEIATTEGAARRALEGLAPARLDTPFPEPVAGLTFQTGDLLVHIVVHLGFHLGQVDAHRRLLTSATQTIEPMSLNALASARPA
jgi:hypothetical protein